MSFNSQVEDVKIDVELGEAGADTLSNIFDKFGDDTQTVKQRFDSVDSAISGIVSPADMALQSEVESTTIAAGAGSVATTTRLGLLVRFIADSVNTLLTACGLKSVGKVQIFTKTITSAANAGDVTLATATDQAVLIKSVTIKSNGVTTADLTNIAIFCGSAKVVTLIDAVSGLKANLAAEDQQVSTGQTSVLLPSTGTIVATLTGTGATAVNLVVEIECEAVVSGGYLS